MYVGVRVTQDAIHRAAARITQLLNLRPDEAAAAVDEFAAACSALPLGQSGADLASALGHNTCRRLEAAALQRFQQQLRPRPDGAMPRALAELRSAAKAWRMSPLVLLAEFAHAPKSDNFWRLLSRLARSHLHGSWPAVRERLHAARHRRRHDLLARRQGVSHVQPWAIPDIMAVLQQQEQEQGQDGQCQDEAFVEGGRQEVVAVAQKTVPSAAQTDALDGDNAALPLPRGPGSEGDSGNDSDDNEDSNVSINTIQVSNSEQTSVWRFAYGWWLPGDVVGRLCISLAQIQPTFAVVGVVVPPAADTTTDILPPLALQTVAATFIAPLHIKTSNHWVLATLCPSEKVASVYDPLLSRMSQAEAAAALDRVFATQFPGEKLGDWAVVARSCPTQTSTVDSGVAAIVFSLYCLVGRAIPQSMDFWLWRRMLAFYLTRLSPDNAAQTAKDIALASVFATNHTHHNVHTPAVISPPPSTEITADTTTAVIALAAEPQQQGASDQIHIDNSTTQAIQTTPSVGRNNTALRDGAIEGRAIWTAAAHLASKAEAEAHRRLVDMAEELERSRQALDLFLYHKLERGSQPGRRDAKTSPEGEGDALAISVSRLETAVKTAEAHVAGIVAAMNGIRAVLGDVDGFLTVLASKHADNS